MSKQKLVAKVCSFQQTLLMLSIDWCDDELVVEVEPHECVSPVSIKNPESRSSSYIRNSECLMVFLSFFLSLQFVRFHQHLYWASRCHATQKELL